MYTNVISIAIRTQRRAGGVQTDENAHTTIDKIYRVSGEEGKNLTNNYLMIKKYVFSLYQLSVRVPLSFVV
jgi:RNA:NAD 2'-phosphotransferase (TPT1/KptA family)